MRKTYLFLFAVALGGGFAHAQNSSILRNTPEIRVRIVKTPSLHAVIQAASMQADRGRNIYNVRFRVKNTAKTSLTAIRLLVMAVTADGSVKGGEVICQTRVPAPGRELEYSVPLASQFEGAGDYAGMAVLQTRRHGQQESVSPTAILDAVAFGQEVADLGSVSHSVAPDVGCDATFCLECRDIARDVCASRGVHQFSCSVKDCTCSFTCN